MFEDITKIVIMSDMDGTLLNSEKKITEKDRQAIEKFVSLGGKFTVSTGRTLESFEQYRKMLDLRIPVIMYNGGIIYDYQTEKILYAEYLPDSARKITSELLEAMPSTGGEILKTDRTYVFRNNYYQQRHTDICGISPVYADLQEITDDGWLKVLFAMSPEEIPVMEEIIAGKDYKEVDFVKSSEIFIEMLPHNISKGSAVGEYRKLSGMEDCTFIAIGDFDNDREMIQTADIGVCPANAQESVKAVADIVLENTNNTGAVSELIEYVIEKCNEKNGKKTVK
ncbi:MAG: Cof-type HAD-IIB family hydrolase [Ruminococcus sp.]|nr:Cof-type HAD-IIB family hydrolase [Ruminococcus sp.]